MLKHGCLFLAVVLVLTLASTAGRATPLSDTITVADTLGFYHLIEGLEETATAEPGKVTANVPAVTVTIGANEVGGASDTLTISAFQVTLASNAGPEPNPDRGETTEVKLVINVISGAVPQHPDFSDQLKLTQDAGPPKEQDIIEGGGVSSVSVSTDAIQARPMLDADGSVSDTFHMDAATITLTSPINPETTPDLTENWTDTITITAVSMPEPSTVGLLVTGLAGLLVLRRWRPCRS
jgi:hypothetical protein